MTVGGGADLLRKPAAKSNPPAMFLFPFCQLNKFEHVSEIEIPAARVRGAAVTVPVSLHLAVGPDSSWAARHISPLDIHTQTFLLLPSALCFFFFNVLFFLPPPPPRFISFPASPARLVALAAARRAGPCLDKGPTERLFIPLQRHNGALVPR